MGTHVFAAAGNSTNQGQLAPIHTVSEPATRQGNNVDRLCNLFEKNLEEMTELKQMFKQMLIMNQKLMLENSELKKDFLGFGYQDKAPNPNLMLTEPETQS